MNNPWKQYNKIQVHNDIWTHPSRPWWICINKDNHVEYRRWDGKTTFNDEERLAKIDAAFPLPIPPCCTGQVWRQHVTDSCRDRVIVSVLYHESRNTHYWFGDMGACSTGAWFSTWPPPNSILVDGPHSPWAPADWEMNNDKA
jgi:hypothetical protein